ncbi:MAG: AraC family transcriptional regulator [Puniceicoccaceae bacterium]|nr:MAG: AraC family transcriptional regulator [Puniceicoccaceae bacterium]
MRGWSPVLVQRTDLRVRGIELLSLHVNRHRLAEVRPHTHDHAQIILYLTGGGCQQVGPRRLTVEAGALFDLPPGCRHGFSSDARTRPLCLVANYRRPARIGGRLRRRRLEQEELNHLHGLLSRLPPKGRLSLDELGLVLQVLDPLLSHRSRGAAIPTRPETLASRLEGLVAAALPASLALPEAARRLGYERDYLTRRLRREGGRGFKEIRDGVRLAAAQRALHDGLPVARAAEDAGFQDPAYFSRWFRRLTGCCPSTFARPPLPARR